MARTSKKKQTASFVLAGKQPEKIYSAGIYARLSVDANERKNESIEIQVEIAKEFIRQQEDMERRDSLYFREGFFKVHKGLYCAWLLS